MDLAKHQRRPRLELQLRHNPDNLHVLYPESEDPVERSRWHAIRLLATGHSIPQVAQTLGYATRWVRDTLHLYHEGKPMADLRHQNPGQPPLLPPEFQETFRQALRQPHLRDGLRTIRNAAEWLWPTRGPEAGLELDEAPGLRSPPPPAPGEGP